MHWLDTDNCRSLYMLPGRQLHLIHLLLEGRLFDISCLWRLFTLFQSFCHFLSTLVSCLSSSSSFGLASSFLALLLLFHSLWENDREKSRTTLCCYQGNCIKELSQHRHACLLFSFSLHLPLLDKSSPMMKLMKRKVYDRQGEKTDSKRNNLVFSVMNHYYWWQISKRDFVSELYMAQNKGSLQCIPALKGSFFYDGEALDSGLCCSFPGI